MTSCQRWRYVILEVGHFELRDERGWRLRLLCFERGLALEVDVQMLFLDDLGFELLGASLVAGCSVFLGAGLVRPLPREDALNMAPRLEIRF